MANGPVLIALLALAGLAAATLLGLALAGFARRRSASYLLVALALATLLARVGVATAAMAGLLADTDHHLAEHVLDVLMAALVIAAVYTARSVRQRATPEPGDVAPDGGGHPPADGDPPAAGEPGATRGPDDTDTDREVGDDD
jgi:Kef-type K+ transport system membrane component KefB